MNEHASVPPARGTNRFQQQVYDFHVAMGRTVGDTPAIRDADLRIELLREEVREFTEAVEAGDLAHAMSELSDIVYVAMGAGISFGCDITPFFEAVHAANMRKLGGPVRADGKMLKPEGWQPADPAPILAEQIERSRR